MHVNIIDTPIRGCYTTNIINLIILPKQNKKNKWRLSDQKNFIANIRDMVRLILVTAVVLSQVSWAQNVSQDLKAGFINHTSISSILLNKIIVLIYFFPLQARFYSAGLKLHSASDSSRRCQFQ